jgi:hypothetical protein
LDESVRDAVMSAYAHIKTANHALEKFSNLHPTDLANIYNEGTLNTKFIAAREKIQEALGQIQKFLSKD